MKKKRFFAVCMAVLMVWSMLAATAATSNAAGEPRIMELPVTVRFVDGDTGEPVNVGFTSLQAADVDAEEYVPVFGAGGETYTWTPPDKVRQQILITYVPSGYKGVDSVFTFSYENGTPQALSQGGSGISFPGYGVVEIPIYQENSFGSFSVEFRYKSTGRLIEDGSIKSVFLSSIINPEPVHTQSLYRYKALASGMYTALFVPQEGGAIQIGGGVCIRFEEGKISKIGPAAPLNPWPAEDTRILGNRAIFLVDVPDERATSKLKVQFADARTGLPVRAAWSMYAEDFSAAQWDVQGETSSQKELVPGYYQDNYTEMTYYLMLEGVPNGYARPDWEEVAFRYGDAGATQLLTENGEPVYQGDDLQIDSQANTVTFFLHKLPPAETVSLRFQDRVTGVAVTPDTVTVKPTYSSVQDVFHMSSALSFVPAYYTTSTRSASYDIEVQAAGYEKLKIQQAFTYYGSITGAANTNHISVSGNLVTLKLDKIPPVDPQPTGNLLKNPGFEDIGILNWNQRGSNPSIMLTNSKRHGGAYAVYLDYIQNEGFNNHLEQACAVSAAGDYQFSVFIKTDFLLTDAGAILIMEAMDADGQLLISGSSAVLSKTNGGWQRLSMQLYAPPETASIVVKIGGIYCTGGFFADDAQLIRLA